MKLTISNRHLPPAKALDALIETRLVALADRVRIDEVSVTVEYRQEASPPFRVALLLAVPGPDLRAEMIDNTPLQAFTRALEDIERRLRDRSLKRLGRPSARTTRTSAYHMRAARMR
jgi:ribosome-associated translation inhibitor RaiA